jgi:hypothetical protein
VGLVGLMATYQHQNLYYMRRASSGGAPACLANPDDLVRHPQSPPYTPYEMDQHEYSSFKMFPLLSLLFPSLEAMLDKDGHGDRTIYLCFSFSACVLRLCPLVILSSTRALG